jgi:hypothetical protein
MHGKRFVPGHLPTLPTFPALVCCESGHKSEFPEGQLRARNGHCIAYSITSLALRKPWKARARYLLKIAAVAYLRKLDELHGDRSARLVADQALAVQPTLVETSHRYVRASRRKNTFEFAPRLLENGVEKELLDTGCRNRIFLEKCALVRDH